MRKASTVPKRRKLEYGKSLVFNGREAGLRQVKGSTPAGWPISDKGGGFQPVGED